MLMVMLGPAMELPVKALPETSWMHWVEAADHPLGRDPVTTGLLDDDTGGTIAGLVKTFMAPGPPHRVLISPEHPMLHWVEGMLGLEPLSNALPQ
jgi:hypothetical protein